MLDPAGDVAAAKHELALLADADGVIGTEEVPCRMVDQPLDQDFGIGPVADPEKHVDRPDQGDAEGEGLFEQFGLANGVSRRLDRAIGPAGEPEPARQRDQRDDAVIITEMPDIQPLRAGIVHHRALAELHGLVLIADQMVRDAQHPFHIQRGGRIIQLARNALALLAGAERAVKIPDPGQVDVQSAQQPELPVQILEIPRQLKTARERRPDRFGIALREHHGDAERGLQRHFLAVVDRIRIERGERLLRPAIALRQQCQFEEELRRRSRQIHADRSVAAIRKAPGQRGPTLGKWSA